MNLIWDVGSFVYFSCTQTALFTAHMLSHIKKNRRIYSKPELCRYIRKCYVTKGKSTWMNFYIGHTLAIETLFNVKVLV